MERAKLVNGLLEMDVNIFIIPNGFTRIGEWISDSQNRKMKNLAAEILKNANKEMEEDEVMCQVWIHNKDLGIENMSCHGFRIDVNGEEQFICPYFGNVPAKMFEGKHEGDIVDILFTYAITGKDNNMLSCDILLHAKLNQLESRYRSFGSFETVFNSLMAHVSPRKIAANGCEAAGMEV